MVSDETIKCEVCIDSVAGAIAATNAGADRVELCANLHEGGTTPSLGMIRSVLAATPSRVMVMIRPRGGDFCFDAYEKQVMLRDVEYLLEHPQVGFVIGALTRDGRIDLPTCRDLRQLATGRSVTFHRAFDHVRDPFEALEQLVQLRCDRVLTSGHAESAEAGVPLLRELTLRARERIAIMAGAGIHPTNAARIIQQTGVKQIHFSGSGQVDSPVEFTRTDVPMSSRTPPDDRIRRVTSQHRVQQICQAARSVSRQAEP